MTNVKTLDNHLFQNLLALCIGVSGYFIALQLGFPAPALTGPASFVSIAALCGARLDIHVWLRNCIFMLIGIAMGTNVTPAVLTAATRWPESFLLLSISTMLIFFICRKLLRTHWKLDVETSTLAATPGHMSYILGLTLNSNADVATVSVIQSIRVLSLTLVIPLIMTIMGYETAAIESQSPLLSTVALLGIIAATIGCAFLFEKVSISPAFLMAGMFVSSLCFVTGSIEGIMPEYVYLPSIVAMGTLIGTRLSGVRWETLKEAASSGFVLMLLAVLFSSIAAGLYAFWSGLPFGQLLIAFAPGGLETMIAMSILLDADPAYVAAHHVWRLILLTFLAPVMLARK